MFRNGLEPWHIIILVLAFILLFGYKKLPDAARSVGRSMRIFKAETKGLVHGDDDPAVEDGTAAPAAAVDPAAVKAKSPVSTVKATPPPAAAPTRAADQERV
jgi:sec-independent protein translocase protein TatA